MYYVYDLDSTSAKVVNMATLRSIKVTLDELFELCKTDRVKGIDLVQLLYGDDGDTITLPDMNINDYSGFIASKNKYESGGHRLIVGGKIPIGLYVESTDLSINTEDLIVINKGSHYSIWCKGMKGVLDKIQRVRAIFIENNTIMAVKRCSGDSNTRYEEVTLLPLLSDIENMEKRRFIVTELLK